MILSIIMIFFVLPTLNAPTWCFVLAWIGVVLKFVLAILKGVLEGVAKYLKDLEA